MTPQLQIAIKMLALSHQEMTDMISQELVENPLLEESAGDDSEEGLSAEEIHTDESNVDSNQTVQNEDGTFEPLQATSAESTDDFDWEKYIEPYSEYSSSSNFEEKFSEEDNPNYDQLVSPTMGLSEHLDSQIRLENYSDIEFQFARTLIYSINQDGFLDGEWTDFAREAGIELDRAKEILKLVQQLDPVGCATKNSMESLLIQAEFMEDSPYGLKMLIENHLEDLYKKNYEIIMKKIGISLNQLKLCELALGTLNPRPGRQISGDNAQYIAPDIYVKEVAGELVVHLNNDGVPDLKISKIYKALLKGKTEDGNSRNFIKDKLKSAVWLIKSIENRQKTILKVARTIVQFQPDFFRKGPQFLRPMILKDVATEIGMHESTVSRVTTSKYMHTPMGVFELKYFFNSGIGGVSSGAGTTGEVIKMRIKQMIDKEDSNHPLSDERIVVFLAETGVEVARRTVAKYRDELGILSSSKRKRSG